jgi:putative FmdB family regulatory protein
LPLYDYRCRACSQVTEVRHGFGVVHQEACPECGGELARVFSPTGIVFKGSGFYLTDSRKALEKAKSPGSGTAAAESAKPAETAKAAEATSTTPTAAPVAAAPAASTAPTPSVPKSESSAA